MLFLFSFFIPNALSLMTMRHGIVSLRNNQNPIDADSPPFHAPTNPSFTTLDLHGGTSRLSQCILYVKECRPNSSVECSKADQKMMPGEASLHPGSGEETDLHTIFYNESGAL